MTTGRSPGGQGLLRRGWVRAYAWATRSPANAGTALLVTALVVSLPFGGWRPAEQEQVPQVPVGHSVSAAPLEVTVLDAVHGQDLGGHLSAESFHDAQYAMVVLAVRNTSDDTLSWVDLRDSMSVTGLPEPAGAGGAPEEEGTSSAGWTSLLDVDGPPQALGGLAPGLDYVLGVYHRTLASEGELAGAELTVTLSTRTYRQETVSDAYRWLDPSTTATVTVPLRASEPLGWAREVRP